MRGEFAVLRKKMFLGVAVLALGVTGSMQSAFALDCQNDIAGLIKSRLSIIGALNHSMKATHGKLNPITACPALRRLSLIESKMATYFKANGAWCHIPDTAVAGIVKAHANDTAMAGKACAFAVKIKKMQAARAAGMRQQQQQLLQSQAPQLPRGPL